MKVHRVKHLFLITAGFLIQKVECSARSAFKQAAGAFITDVQQQKDKGGKKAVEDVRTALSVMVDEVRYAERAISIELKEVNAVVNKTEGFIVSAKIFHS
jgi:hypothetical protein